MLRIYNEREKRRNDRKNFREETLGMECMTYLVYFALLREMKKLKEQRLSGLQDAFTLPIHYNAKEKLNDVQGFFSSIKHKAL